MTADELLRIIKTDGFESLGLFFSSYPGTVVDTKDPEKAGRIKLKCPDVYGNQVSDWATCKGIAAGKGYGVWVPPEPGDPVWVSFRSGNPEFPMWEGGYWTKGSKPGETLILKTKKGQYIEIDQDKDKVVLHTKKFHVELSPDGLKATGGTPKVTLELTSSGGTIKIGQSKLEVTPTLAKLIGGVAPLPEQSAILGDLFAIHYTALMTLLGTCPTIITAAGSPLGADPVFTTLLSQVQQLLSKNVKVN